MKNKLLPVVLGAVSMWVGGCAVYPEYDTYYDYQQPVVVAPPPPRYENPGYAPAVGFLWIEGYWNWSGVRYIWVPGRWEAPRPGYYWIPHRWEHEGDHWRRTGGNWERDTRHRPEPAPVRRMEPPPAVRPPPPPVQVITPAPDRIQRPEAVIVVPREGDRRGASNRDDRRRDEQPPQFRERREVRPEPARVDGRHPEPADARRPDDRRDRRDTVDRGDRGDRGDRDFRRRDRDDER